LVAEQTRDALRFGAAIHGAALHGAASSQDFVDLVCQKNVSSYARSRHEFPPVGSSLKPAWEGHQ
jgi:hypothetical protein